MIENKIDKYLGEATDNKELENFEKIFSGLDSQFDRMWKLTRQYDSKRGTEIWSYVAKDIQKLVGLVNDIGTEIINMMKKNSKS